MKSDDLHAVVAQAVGQQWENFASSHPCLAAAMDRELLIQQAVQSVRDDPKFMEAIAGVQAQGAAEQKLQNLAGSAIRKILGLVRDS